MARRRRFPQEFYGAGVRAAPHERSVAEGIRGLRAYPTSFMMERERVGGGGGLTMCEREVECQADIVDGDNAAEIAGEQRGLMMTLLASGRTSELSAWVWTLELLLPHSSSSERKLDYSLRRSIRTTLSLPASSGGWKRVTAAPKEPSYKS